MSTITVTQSTFSNYQGGGSTATVRIYANDVFVPTSGSQINKSRPGSLSWYKSIAATVAANVVTVPQFTIDSTTDSSKPGATYSAVLFDSSGRFVSYLFRNWAIPHDLGATIDWADLDTYNENAPAAAAGVAYTQQQVNTLIPAVIAQNMIVKRQDTSQAESSEATLQDTELIATVEIAEYQFEAFLHVQSDAGGVRLAFGGTATISEYIAQYVAESATANTRLATSRITTATNNFTYGSGGSDAHILIRGSVKFTAAGTFKLQFAQKDADPSGTSLLQGSGLIMHKVN